MATSNKAISAYIPPDIEEYLTQYCTEYGITRKDRSGETKPALGTAVVEILKVFFSSGNVQAPLPDNVSLLPNNVVTEDRLSEALSQLKTSSDVSSNLPSNVVTEERLKELISNLPSTLPSTLLTKDDLSDALSTVPSIVNNEFETAIASLREEMQQLASDNEFIQAIASEVKK